MLIRDANLMQGRSNVTLSFHADRYRPGVANLFWMTTAIMLEGLHNSQVQNDNLSDFSRQMGINQVQIEAKAENNFIIFQSEFIKSSQCISFVTRTLI